MILTVEWCGEFDVNLGIELKTIPVVACSSVDHYPSLSLLCSHSLTTLFMYYHVLPCTCNVSWCGALNTS
jgi:hypothetical protein